MGLLERGAEYHALLRALNALPSERGHVVAVIGAPGMGKTAIGAMARSLGSDAGVQVLRARGAELEQRFAYGVVRQLFERVVRTATAEEREELFAEAAAGARSVVDPQIAGALIRLARMTGLLGARTTLVGVRPEITQSIVGLGIDLLDLRTSPTLAAAISALRASRQTDAA